MHRLLPLLLALGCAPDITTATYTDGLLCVQEDAATVEFDLCLSSSCDTLKSAECTAVLDGDTITVTAEAVVETEGDECTADCGLVFISCDLPEGIDDTMSVVWGAESETLALMRAGTCLGA